MIPSSACPLWPSDQPGTAAQRGDHADAVTPRAGTRSKAQNRTEIDVIFTLDEELGRSICRRRKVLGMTQAHLGAAVGVSFQQIQKNECGVNKMSAVQIWKIANALGLSVDDLFADATRSTLKPKYSGVNLNDSAQFVELTAELQPRARHALTAFVQSLSTSA